MLPGYNVRHFRPVASNDGAVDQAKRCNFLNQVKAAQPHCFGIVAPARREMTRHQYQPNYWRLAAWSGLLVGFAVIRPEIGKSADNEDAEWLWHIENRLVGFDIQNRRMIKCSQTQDSYD